ncbi:ATP-dependent transcriptional regulator, MalT-like, LuxR family [Mycolicibacterium rhodesiae JS60]|nr:ATP-dependent transcriptional regulator, MalT-like, LuxR family [Mycolicibacterium rhodesiae JS60]
MRSLRSLLTEGRPGAILAGQAGVGKTHLAHACLDMAAEMGFATRHVTATNAAAGIPFGALATLLPTVATDPSPQHTDRADLISRSASALVEQAAPRRLVILVDDVHLLDDLSATLIHQLAERNLACVIGTLRVDATAPDAITTLWKDEILHRLDLVPFDAAEVQAILAAALDGPVDPGTAHELAERSGGNALFLRELVLGALHSESLSNSDGIWRLSGHLAPTARLTQLVESRLGALTPEERALLELVSFAEPLGQAELSELADSKIAETLERKGLLNSRVDGRRLEIRLAHPLYGDVVRAGIPAPQIRLMARKLADIVERCGARRREDLLRVATWRLDAGAADPLLMLAAAHTARSRHDLDLAQRLTQAAIADGAGFDARLLLTDLYTLQGRVTEADRELAAMVENVDGDDQRGQIAVRRLQIRIFCSGLVGDELALADDALARIDDPAWRDEVTAIRVGVLMAVRGPAEAAQAVEPLLRRAEGRTLAWASLWASNSLSRLGRTEEAVAAAELGHAANVALSDTFPWAHWYHLFEKADAKQNAGYFREAEALASSQYDLALRQGSLEARAIFAWHRCKAVGERGRARDSIRIGLEALALFNQLNRPQFTYYTSVYLAMSYALNKEPKQAAAALDTLDRLALSATFYMGVDLHLARAWTAVAGGDLVTARARLKEAAALGSRMGDLVGQASALHGLARIGYAAEVADDLSALAGQIEGELAPARARHTRSLAEHDPLGLLAAADTFEAMGADLLAAEAAADAAAAWRLLDQPRRAAAAEQRAAKISARCQNPTTQSLQPLRTRTRLTPAERQTALLAAAGRPNRDIAAELSLSIRTVESYLSNTYEKLGIDGRRELAAAFENSAD